MRAFFMSSNLFNFRNVVILTVIVLLPWIAYVLKVDADTVFADQFPLILEFEKFRNGNLNFSELWAAKAGHRLPGYKIMFFVSCMLFGFSAKVETILAVSVFSLGAVCLALKFSDKFETKIVTKWLIFACLLLLFVNGQTLRVTVYSLIAMRLVNIMAFGFIAYQAFKLIGRKKSQSRFDTLGWSLLAIFIFLLFGRGWGMAAALAIVLTLGIEFLLRRYQGEPVQGRKFGIIVGTLVACMLVYLAGLNPKGTAMGTGLDMGSILSFFTGKTGHAYISLIGTDISRIPALAIVMAIFVVSGAIFSTYWIGRDTNRTALDLLALFLIYFAIFSTLMVSIARHNEPPFYQRHNIEIALGAIGLTYVVFRFVADVFPVKFKEISLQILSVGLILLLSRNLWVNVKIAGLLQSDYENKETAQQAAYGQDGVLNPMEYSEMACNMPPKACQRALVIMQKHGISKSRMQEP